jgi:DNA (cytosine-5)-methyltransferase 1
MKKRQNLQLFPNNFKFIDLFAGIGGFRLALESFGGKCVYSSEWDKNAQDTYETNFGERPDGDITKVDEKAIPAHNVICAGFPCQTFSISGKQKGFEDARGTLFFDIARIAKHHQPEILFLENVKNFEKHDNGKTLEVVKKTLNEIGYNVFCKVLNASHYGAPTSRERIYFACFRKDMGIENFNFPPPTNERVKLRDYLDSDCQTDEFVIERDDAKFNGKKVVENMFGEYPLRPVRIGTFNSGGQGERIYSDLGHAVTFSAYGGGVGSKTGAYLINGRVRKLSPRECARVMGFPEDFQIPTNKQQAYQQFGNSVVVPVLKRIFEQILNTTNKQKEYVQKREVDRSRV